MNERSERVLAELGVKPLWRLRVASPVCEEVQHDLPAEHFMEQELQQKAPVVETPSVVSRQFGWPEIDQVLPGEGDQTADYLFLLARNDGEDELAGILSAPAGKLLQAMLGSIGLKREEGVYLACLPGERQAYAAWSPYLQGMLELMQPKVVVLMGGDSVPEIRSIARSGGAGEMPVFEHVGLPWVVMPHPADLLREPGEKARAWEALCLIQDQVQRQKA